MDINNEMLPQYEDKIEKFKSIVVVLGFLFGILVDYCILDLSYFQNKLGESIFIASIPCFVLAILFLIQMFLKVLSKDKWKFSLVFYFLLGYFIEFVISVGFFVWFAGGVSSILIIKH